MARVTLFVQDEMIASSNIHSVQYHSTMLGLTLRSVLLLSSLTAAAPLTQATAPQVTLDYATYQGSTAGGITHFYGMSYAAPPLGDLRFRAPQAPLKAAGVQDATEVRD